MTCPSAFVRLTCLSTACLVALVRSWSSIRQCLQQLQTCDCSGAMFHPLRSIVPVSCIPMQAATEIVDSKCKLRVGEVNPLYWPLSILKAPLHAAVNTTRDSSLEGLEAALFSFWDWPPSDRPFARMIHRSLHVHVVGLHEAALSDHTSPNDLTGVLCFVSRVINIGHGHDE